MKLQVDLPCSVALFLVFASIIINGSSFLFTGAGGGNGPGIQVLPIL